MNRNLGALGVRYLPFLVAFAILAALVVVAPSKGAGPSQGFFASGGAGGTGTDSSGAGGSNGASGAGSSATDSAGGAAANGPGGSAGGGASGGARGSAGTGTGNSLSGAPNAIADPAKCDARGFLKAPYATDVPCSPSFAGGDPGPPLAGVTPTEIRYTVYVPMSNPAINQALVAAGFGETPDQLCQAGTAYEKTIQKYFNFYGRHLVSVDGPGKNAGSANSSSCHYSYYQSQCQSLPPDPACVRADADVIASQKVAMVIAPLADTSLYTELSRRHVIVTGADGAPRAYHNTYAPYFYGIGMAGERILSLAGQYYCNRLVGHKPEYGGADVNAFGNRHVGIVYTQNSGDDSSKISADVFLQIVHACGDTTAKGFTYTSDVTTAETQATNLVAQLRADRVTTVACFCDVIAPAFFLKAADQNGYTPEHMTVGITSIASDVVGQLYYAAAPNQWKHAFGISNFGLNQPDAGLDYRKAFSDGGGQGTESALDVGNWPYFEQMAQMFHMAGPTLTAFTVFRGMQAMPHIPATKVSPSMFYGAPDNFTYARDEAEVWFNPNLVSAYNGKAGAMCYVNNAKRYDLGQFPGGEPSLFSKSGPCATL